MAQFRGLSGTAGREALNLPGLTPRETGDPEFAKPESMAMVGADGTTSSQADLAPAIEYPMSGARVMLADRSKFVFQPTTTYANVDRQKGGAPGNPGSVITSQQEDGTTVVGGIPNSPRKLSYGMADFRHDPTFVQAHHPIQMWSNPNRIQVNPKPFNTEGPQENTVYTTPAPWAVGSFIG